MLCLDRFLGQTIEFKVGDEVIAEIKVLRVGNKVRLGVTAIDQVIVARGELVGFDPKRRVKNKGE